MVFVIRHVVMTDDILKFLVLKVIVLGSAEPIFYDLSSFIKRDPIGTIVVGLGMKYYNLPFIPIPGMIPPTPHIEIKSMLHFEVFQILHKSLIRYYLFRLDNG